MYPASVHDLRVNPAQMRTRVGLMELARLAVQVKDGLDPNLALLLRPDGQGAFTVISGHRRWLALMIATIAYTAPTVAPISAEQDLELMEATIRDLCTIQDGFVVLDEALYEFLQGLVPETLTVPYVLWDGPADAEILLLIKANTGAEEPDLVGQARAFKAAIDAGVSYDTLSQVTGQPAGRLEAQVKLLGLPQVFQDLVNDSLLDLSIIFDLLPLKPKAIKALDQAMGAKYKADKKHAAKEGFDLQDYKDYASKDYTSRVRLAALQMSAEPVVPKRRDVEPATYNLAVAVDALWREAVKSAPDQLYQAVARQSIDGTRITGIGAMMEVLSDVPKVQGHFDVETNQYGRTEITLTDEAIEELLPERTCRSCAFSELPTVWVKHELPLACRERPSGVAAGPCLSWTPKGKRFSMRTPYYWTKGGEQVTSLDELQAAWQAQWDREHGDSRPSGMLSGSSEDMAQQRRNIRFFMERHTQEPFTVDHPWATSCSRCAHHLEGSPVKSAPDAPHCAWAKGKRRLQFRAYVPVEGAAMSSLIPSCLQFQPVEPWADIVPEPFTEAPYEREVLITLIEGMAESVNRNVYATDSKAALQFLTGRPMSASANHRRTFEERFKEEEPSLSNGQLWTLLQWLLLEWTRFHHHATKQMVPFREIFVVETEVQFLSTALGLFRDDEDEE